jgi:tRNA (guanine37-N1)-methyltransferase
MAQSIDIISIFPEMFDPVLRISITGRAISKGALVVRPHNLRDYTVDRHRSTDDSPYGGGSGMVMLLEPMVRAMKSLEASYGQARKIVLAPTGRPLNQKIVRELAQEERLILLCGRYEGMDERIHHYVDDEISIGDFVLTGGELPAMILIDALARLIPGVLHNEHSSVDESFESGLLEYPQYSRPAESDGLVVPPVLLSGNHEVIRRWRRQLALVRTRERRPDLFGMVALSEEDRRLLAAWDAERRDTQQEATSP